MKADKQIQKDVMEQLNFDPAINSENIGVSVKDGIVTLSGTVPSYAEKYAAEKRAFRVQGVKSVVEEIEVKLEGAKDYKDYDIARAASDALEWNVLILPSVKASVQGGIVTLRGETEWSYQRDSAEASVRHLKGVRGVNNLITLRLQPELATSDAKSRIEKALTRAARDEAKKINVTVHDNTVVLTGHVRSKEEMNEARWAAWAVPGISKVENNLIIE